MPVPALKYVNAMKHSYCSVGSVWPNGYYYYTKTFKLTQVKCYHQDFGCYTGHFEIDSSVFFFAREASMFLKVPVLSVWTPPEIVPGSHPYRRLSPTLTFMWI